jgi:hypothetical protein
MTVPETEISKIQVVLTLVGGQIVYQDSVMTAAERFGRRVLDIVKSVVEAKAKPAAAEH